MGLQNDNRGVGRAVFLLGAPGESLFPFLLVVAALCIPALPPSSRGSVPPSPAVFMVSLPPSLLWDPWHHTEPPGPEGNAHLQVLNSLPSALPPSCVRSHIHVPRDSSVASLGGGCIFLSGAVPRRKSGIVQRRTEAMWMGVVSLP